MARFNRFLEIFRTFRSLNVTAAMPGELALIFIFETDDDFNQTIDDVSETDIILFYHNRELDDEKLKEIFPSFVPTIDNGAKYVYPIGHILDGNARIVLRKWRNEHAGGTYYVRRRPDYVVINDILKIFLHPSIEQFDMNAAVTINDNGEVLSLLASNPAFKRTVCGGHKKLNMYHFERIESTIFSRPVLGIVNCVHHSTTNRDERVQMKCRLDKIFLAGSERSAYKLQDPNWFNILY